MTTLPGFSSLFSGPSTSAPHAPPPPPHVPRPRLERQNNLTTAHVVSAFRHEYWLQKQGDRNAVGLMQNILTIIQEILEIVLDEYESQYSKKFPTYLKQKPDLKKAIQNRFFELLERHEFEEEGDRLLIKEMMIATKPLDEQSEGRHWLFEHCIRRTTENRAARVKNGTKKKSQGVAYWEGNSGGSSRQSYQ
ncbi:hypothetical protein TWF481_002578 [Arthrobotrys musiformis]|uniref:Uncharacterized protein n=1 Tax=Arthrobotrys musiformis TaxID=47236 RepID=A0AAV9VSN0_9PEZI